MKNLDHIGLQKAILWEEAKGKLRAVAKISGAIPSNETREPNWNEVDGKIEKFIKQFEYEGLHE